jgi:hypothetical protein
MLFYTSYSAPSIRQTYGERRGLNWDSKGKSERKRSIRRPRRRWENNIKMDIQEIE